MLEPITFFPDLFHSLPSSPAILTRFASYASDMRPPNPGHFMPFNTRSRKLTSSQSRPITNPDWCQTQ